MPWGVHGQRVCVAGGSICDQGACMAGDLCAGGHAWPGACVAGGNAWWGACVAGGHACTGHVHGRAGEMATAVGGMHLLECILVKCMRTNLFNFCYHSQFEWITRYQWQIQDFPWEGAPTPKVGVLTYYFAFFLLKTAWKWKNWRPPWIRQWIHINWIIDDQILLSVSRWFGWKEMIWFSSVLVTNTKNLNCTWLLKLGFIYQGPLPCEGSATMLLPKGDQLEYEESIRVFPILVLKLGEFILLVESDKCFIGSGHWQNPANSLIGKPSLVIIASDVTLWEWEFLDKVSTFNFTLCRCLEAPMRI